MLQFTTMTVEYLEAMITVKLASDTLDAIAANRKAAISSAEATAEDMVESGLDGESATMWLAAEIERIDTEAGEARKAASDIISKEAGKVATPGLWLCYHGIATDVDREAVEGLTAWGTASGVKMSDRAKIAEARFLINSISRACGATRTRAYTEAREEYGMFRAKKRTEAWERLAALAVYEVTRVKAPDMVKKAEEAARLNMAGEEARKKAETARAEKKAAYAEKKARREARKAAKK